MIRVLLVDDSPAVLLALREGLSGLGDIEVVATATDARAALEMIQKFRPQVLCASFDLPGMSGLELTRLVMREAPLPVLLLTAQSEQAASETTVLAREAGALELLLKPPHAPGSSISVLATRLRVLAGVKVFARRKPSLRPGLVGSDSSGAASPRLVAIGASTGGPQALGRLLKILNADFPLPIVCVQHMSSGFLDGMVAWLASQTRIGVRVARNGEVPVPGQVYFAPEDQHLKVKSDGALGLDHSETVDGHRPSATVLLRSVAEVYGAASVGVLLTGMGADGARGLLAMAQAGATTMAQDEESSVVFGMPRQAVEMGAVKHAMSLDEIGSKLRAYSERRRS